jgi:hypothetical protein
MPVPVYPSDEPDEEEAPDGESPTLPLRCPRVSPVVAPGH